MIFVTSDTHFNHDKEFLYYPRGFNSIQEHDEKVIENWNSIVRPTDEVYHLGDFMMSGDLQYGINCMKSLNGFIYLIVGNHDSKNRLKEVALLDNVEVIGYGTQLKYNKDRSYFLCHYPTLCASWSREGKINSKVFSLCGHAHTQNRFVDWPYGGIYHCELDAHNCFPKALDEIHKEINQHLSIF